MPNNTGSPTLDFFAWSLKISFYFISDSSTKTLSLNLPKLSNKFVLI